MATPISIPGGGMNPTSNGVVVNGNSATQRSCWKKINGAGSTNGGTVVAPAATKLSPAFNNVSAPEADSNSGGSGENSPPSSGDSTPISTSFFGRLSQGGSSVATPSQHTPPSPATVKRLLRIRKMSEICQKSSDKMTTIPTELSDINKEFAKLIINQHRIKHFQPPLDQNCRVTHFEVDNCKKSSGDLSTTCRMKTVIAGDREANNGEEEIEYVFINKLLPADDPNRVYVFEANVFEKEISIYFELMPCLRQMCAGTPLLDFMTHHIPQCIYASNNGDGAGVLVFECAEERGYLPSTEPAGLSFNQVMSVLDVLANVHAIGSAMLLKKGKSLCLRYPFLSSNVYSSQVMYEGAKQMFATYKEFLASFINSDSSNDDNDTDSTSSLHDTFVRCCDEQEGGQGAAEKMFTCLRRQVSSPFNTIIHGEAWEKNLIFRDRRVKKEDAGSSKTECVVLDWKNAKIASATKDIAFLLLSSVSDELRRQHLTTFLKAYYTKFCDGLTALDVDINECTGMSYDDFYRDYCTSTMGAFLQSVCVLVQEMQFMERRPDSDLALLSVYEKRALNLMRDSVLNATHFKSQ